MIQVIPHNLYVSFKLTSLYCELRIIPVYLNPLLREADLKLTCRLWGIVQIVLMSPFSWQDQNLWGLGLGFITDWRVVICDIFVPQTKEPVLKHRCLNLLGRALQRNAYALENPTPKRITWVKGERF